MPPPGPATSIESLMQAVIHRTVHPAHSQSHEMPGRRSVSGGQVVRRQLHKPVAKDQYIVQDEASIS